MCRYDRFPCAAFREHKRLTGRPCLFSYAGRGARTSDDRRQVPQCFIGAGVRGQWAGRRQDLNAGQVNERNGIPF